jgi:hypothetical protein
MPANAACDSPKREVFHVATLPITAAVRQIGSTGRLRPSSPVERDLAGPNRKRRALSCDMAAFANAPPLRVSGGFGCLL